MKRRWLAGLGGIVAIGLLCGFLINGCSTMNVRPNSAELARERQSAQWSVPRGNRDYAAPGGERRADDRPRGAAMVAADPLQRLP